LSNRDQNWQGNTNLPLVKNIISAQKSSSTKGLRSKAGSVVAILPLRMNYDRIAGLEGGDTIFRKNMDDSGKAANGETRWRSSTLHASR
jgi:hypothetical protein